MHVFGMQLFTGVSLMTAVGFSLSAAAEECLTDWGTAGQIVRREKLLTVQQLTQFESSRLPGTIVKTTLCKAGDDYIYKVVVRGTGGALKTIVVDARTPMPEPMPAAAAKSR